MATLNEHVAPAADEIDAMLRTLNREPYQLRQGVSLSVVSLEASFADYAAHHNKVEAETGEDSAAQGGRNQCCAPPRRTK